LPTTTTTAAATTTVSLGCCKGSARRENLIAFLPCQHMGANAYDAGYFSFLREMKLDRFCADHLGPRRTHKNHMLKIKGLKCSGVGENKLSPFMEHRSVPAALIKQ
jgi:hypothetical protein